MVLDPQLRVNLLERDGLGALALRVQRPGFDPICVIGVYNPPHGSTLNADGRRYSQNLMNSVAEMAVTWRRKYGDVFITGDLNMRFGNVAGLHETEDAGVGALQTRSKDIRRLCRYLRMLPVHGRPPHIEAKTLAARWENLELCAAPSTCAYRARCTSAAPANRTAFTSEVDYILASADVSNDRVTPIHEPPDAADSYPSTHRPVAATITLQPAASGPVAPAAKRERTPRADYGDADFWHAAATHINAALPALRELVADPTADPAAVLTALEQTHKDAMRVAAEANGHRTTRGIRHKYRGIRTPPWADALFDRARALRKAFASARRAAANARRKDPLGSTTLDAAAADAKRELTAANTAARSAAGRIISSRINEALKRLERARVANPHGMYAELRRITGDTPSTFTHSSGIPGDDAATTFSEAFAELFKETRTEADIAGLSSRRDFWAAFLPTVDPATRTQHAAMLDSPISEYEVYLAVFPATRALIAHLPLQGHAHCTLCRMHREQLQEWDPADPTSPAPDLGTHIRGGKAPGSAGITAEMLRYPRLREDAPAARFADRIAYCKVLAAAFERYRDAGDVPRSPTWTDSVVTPILKKSVPGHRVDAENPDDYRGIAAGNTIPKVFGLVLLRRLMHWCVATGVIPPNQAGFMVNNSAEFQVFTALETLRHRKRCRDDTYLLFLDLRKAYDSVPQAALWAILRHMGVPDHLVRLLEAWNSARRCCVRVNGELSDAFNVSKGLPQGDVLSPLLFNLYITMLMKRIALLEGYTGVTWDGTARVFTVKDLWYADDMLAMAPDRAQLQRLLDAIHEWSTDWGIAIGTGSGKTNAMLVPHAATTPKPVEPLMAGTAAVPWTDEYRYLGFNLTPDLKRTAYLEAINRRMGSVAARYITHNSVVQRLSVGTQLQLLNTLVLGCANYLLAVIPLTDTETRVLDGHLLTSARQIIGAHTKQTPTAAVAADSRIPPLQAITLQHRLRFQQTLDLLPNRDTPAVQAMLALRDRPAGAINGAGNTKAWTAQTAMLAEAALQRTGIAPGAAAAQLWHVPQTSGREGRRYAYSFYRGGIQTATDMVVGVPPTAHTPTAMAAFLQCIGHYDMHTADDRGDRLRHVMADAFPLTPASAYGAGGNGSLIALSTRLKTVDSLIIQRFRLGTAGILMWPFAAPGTTDDDGDDVEQATRMAVLSSRMQQNHCHLCEGAPTNPWHLATNCSCDHVATWRTRAQQSAGRLLLTLCDIVTTALDKLPTGPPAATLAACAALREASGGIVWDSVDGAQLLIRLLCAVPFSAHDIRAPAAMARLPRQGQPAAAVHAAAVHEHQPLPACSALATLLDTLALSRHLMRPFANAWLAWSVRQISELAGTYTCASRSATRNFPCPICEEAGHAAATYSEDDIHECPIDAAA
jgi:hypothetical protein